jgi:hypothetical protein
VPWGYLAGLLALTLAAGAVAASAAVSQVMASTPDELRDL